MRSIILRGLSWAQAHQHREEGQTLIEYALVVAVVSIVLAGLLVGFGTDIIDWAEEQVTGLIS